MNGINREILPYWKAYEIRHEFRGETELLHQRCADSFAEFGRQINRELYADPIPFSPPSRWQRFKNWIGDNRITNAWLVLIGCEDIDRGDY
jgi:hypothetical protein